MCWAITKAHRQSQDVSCSMTTKVKSYNPFYYIFTKLLWTCKMEDKSLFPYGHTEHKVSPLLPLLWLTVAKKSPGVKCKAVDLAVVNAQHVRLYLNLNLLFCYDQSISSLYSDRN